MLRTTPKWLKKFSYENGKTTKSPFKRKKEHILAIYYRLQRITIHKIELKTCLELVNNLSSSIQYRMQSETKTNKC